MKKLIFLLCFAVVLSACSCSPQSQDNQQAQQDKGVLESISDAFNKSKSLKCEYTDDETGQKTISYIKNQMIRTESNDFNAIFKDQKMYIWQAGSAQGFVVDTESIEDEEDAAMGEMEVSSADEIIAGLEAYKDYCSIQNVSNSVFDLPANVEFVDFNQMFNFNQ